VVHTTVVSGQSSVVGEEVVTGPLVLAGALVDREVAEELLEDEEMVEKGLLEDEETLVEDDMLADEIVLDDVVLLELRHSDNVEYAVVHSVTSYLLPNLPINGIIVHETREAKHESVLVGVVDVVTISVIVEEVVCKVIVLASEELVEVELAVVS
jgi:hypothetical protein